MKALKRQDRNGARTPTDLERRYNFENIDLTLEEVEYLKKLIVVDSTLSTTSTNAVQNKVITEALNHKVNKETGKGLSSNDFTDTLLNKLNSLDTSAEENVIESISVNGTQQTVTNKNVNLKITDSFTEDYKNEIADNTEARHTHSNKTVLDGITSTTVNKWNNASSVSSYNLANYKVSGLTILRSSCVEKNNRVVINFVGTISMAANTTTVIFNLPSALQPTATKDFVVFGQSSNTDGYVGYGYVTEGGSVQIRFNTAISSYIRFSVTYDLD